MTRWRTVHKRARRNRLSRWRWHVGYAWRDNTPLTLDKMRAVLRALERANIEHQMWRLTFEQRWVDPH